MTAFRLVAASLAVLTCAAMLACGDDDGDTAATPTLTERETPVGGDSPTPNDGKETPIDESPVQTDEPNGDTPTPPPPADEGIRATLVADQRAYFAQFQGRNLQEVTCLYSPVTRVTDCDGIKYAIDPPIVGQDIYCSRGIVDSQPEYIRCQSAEPEQSNVYEIQG